MAKPLEIIARKRSEDPIQEALREHKASWNEKVKLLIAQLIAFKRGINGRGDPRAGIPPSNIKETFPPEIPQYLDEMAQRYLDVVNDAKGIISEQDSYSHNRRKGKKDAPVTAESQDEIVKYASWWGSRLWTVMNQYPIFGGDVATKDRIALLNVTTSVIEYLDEIDNALIESIPEAVYKFLSMKEFFNIRFIKLFSTLTKDYLSEAEKGNLGVQQSEQSEPPQVKQEDSKVLLEKLKQELEDIMFISPIAQISHKLNKSDDFIRKIEDEYKVLDKIGNIKQYDAFINRYRDVVNLIGKEFNIEGNSFKELYDKIESIFKTSMKEFSPAIQKLAQKSLKRWLRRMRLGLFSSEEDRMKLDTIVKLHDSIKTLDLLQDTLEKKSPSMFSIVSKTSDVINNFSEISDQMAQLAAFHNSQQELKKLKDPKYKATKIDAGYINKLKALITFYNKLSEEMLPKEPDNG